MKNETLITAIQEAKRFIEKAEQLQKIKQEIDPNSIYYVSFPKESGSVRRASLDLTRTLADLRQGR